MQSCGCSLDLLVISGRLGDVFDTYLHNFVLIMVIYAIITASLFMCLT